MLSYFEYVYAVYHEQSFSKAAKKLYVSQPWLSLTVKKVEQQLNAQLFNRNTNPITLTEAGKYYIEQIERILEIQNELQEHFFALSSEGGTHLRIGSSMFFCTYVLPKILGQFCQEYPQVTLSFMEGNSTTLQERLKTGDLDLLLEVELPDQSLFHSDHWATEEIVLAVPSNWKINAGLKEYGYSFDAFLDRHSAGKRKPAVPLSAFAKENVIMLTKDNDSYKRSMDICKNASFTPQIGLYVSQMMTAYYLVCEGQGMTFLRSTIPEYVAKTDLITFYQIEDPLARRSIYISHRKKHITAVQQTSIDYFKAYISANDSGASKMDIAYCKKGALVVG